MSVAREGDVGDVPEEGEGLAELVLGDVVGDVLDVDGAGLLVLLLHEGLLPADLPLCV